MALLASYRDNQDDKRIKQLGWVLLDSQCQEAKEALEPSEPVTPVEPEPVTPVRPQPVRPTRPPTIVGGNSGARAPRPDEKVFLEADTLRLSI